MTHKPVLDRLAGVFREHGDTLRGNDWWNPDACEARYAAMAGVAANGPRPVGRPATLLDYGCGSGFFYRHLRDRRPGPDFAYTGMDANADAVAAARAKFPGANFVRGDCRNPESDGFSSQHEQFDYVIACGVLTNRATVPADEFRAYARRLLADLWGRTRVGLAYNVIRPTHASDENWAVDLKEVTAHLTTVFDTQSFLIRGDYKPSEYTVYAYKV